MGDAFHAAMGLSERRFVGLGFTKVVDMRPNMGFELSFEVVSLVNFLFVHDTEFALANLRKNKKKTFQTWRYDYAIMKEEHHSR